ncbi:MAG: HAMP domain-containing sensor histidine kinase [Bacteroidales bacterium]|jgi:signal transduction histidine kinase|nr:HAMP domain-containing sensor histidine kinase [Bacteroidales bacterium]
MKIPNFKLKSQLALFNALSKAFIITLLVIIVPWIVSEISIRDTDDILIHKLDQVIELVDSLGIDNFIDLEAEFNTFGSYNILKEEYISIEPIARDTLFDVIEFSQRIIEEEIVDYRVLSYSIVENDNNYLIEIGKSISTIYLFEHNLKRFTFIFLIIVISLTFILDLSFIQYLLIPFEKIVKKLKSTNHPSSFNYTSIETSTSDFVYLDETIHSLMHKIELAFNDERDYISNVSHELLTPVSIIQSKLDNILHENNLQEADMIKIFESKKTLRRLTNLVRTLLMMSRIENEEYILTEEVNITNTLQNVLEEIEDKIAAKELELKIKFKAEEFVFFGNDNLLFTLFYNFVNNAIRFTDKGYIEIETLKNQKQFIVKISDSGAGIPKDEIPHIFSRFKNSNDKKDSYGLGLALSKKICGYHKIDIEVISEVNIGSTFILKFPN